ncbi:MAG: L-threonylcarbamoyladenylate synthase [Candidatus Promineifilaceae bacterium]
MKTQQFKAEQLGAIDEAADLLRLGHIVAFPTDTVYGVGVDPFSSAAIEQLYRVKGRAAEKGIPILLADRSDLEKVTNGISDMAQTLIDQFWPGPLTIIIPKHRDLPSNISPNVGIAVRIPDHAIARAFITAAGGAVAASSANLSSEPPALSAAEVLESLNGRIAAVLDGGQVQYGEASTVLDCMSNPPKVLREGPITVKNLSRIIANLI